MRRVEITYEIRQQHKLKSFESYFVDLIYPMKNSLLFSKVSAQNFEHPRSFNPHGKLDAHWTLGRGCWGHT